MPRIMRRRREPTDGWQRLRLLSRFPEQLTYELIRPVVLFGSSPGMGRRMNATRRQRFRARHEDAA